MTTTNESTLIRLLLTQIKPGINPRTEFDQEKLAELAQSLKDDGGAVQPIVVYLDDDGMYGLIAGERRWKAAKLAGLESIECVLRAKPAPHNARKLALKENMQREDLTALEIARAVSDMLDEVNEVGVPIYSKTQLADELGKSPQYISSCMALLSCSAKLQQRVHQGKTTLEIAAMIGSLPADMHEMAEQDIVLGPKPMTRDQARDHIAEKYRRDLRKGQFQQDDATLVEGKPACHACEFWGGKRDDVKGKFKDSVCLNPACFDRKQQAFVTKNANAAHDGHGVRMLGQEMRDKVFSFDGVTVKGDSGYVAADEVPDKIMLVDPKSKVAVWGTILADSEIKGDKIVDGDGRVRTLYDAKLAMQAVTAPGSAVKALFKAGAAVKGVSVATKVDGTDAAKEKARATGVVSSGITWVTKIRDSEDSRVTLREITRLLYERLTEPVDREWMGRVLGVKNPLDYEEGKGSAEVLGLALVARTMRLQGPGGINGIAGELAKLIGYDPKKEARDIEALVAAAVKPEKKSKTEEQLFDCAECGGKNFTTRGLATHRCDVRQAESRRLEKARAYFIKHPKCHPSDLMEHLEDVTIMKAMTLLDFLRAEAKKPAPAKGEMISVEQLAKELGLNDDDKAPAKQRGGKREKNAGAEKKALAAYLKTGSIAKAAEACGLDVESVKNWHKRRGWKALREAHVAK